MSRTRSDRIHPHGPIPQDGPARRPRPAGRTTRLAVLASATVLSVTALVLPAQAAAPAAAPPGPAAVRGPDGGPLDRAALRQSLDAFRDAGMYGAYSTVRDGSATWRGAAGVADVDSGRPVRPDFEHRIGSITKTFTAVAVLQQVQAGRVELDAPVGRYLPELVGGERGRQVTVRMLLNHTSGIGDYVLPAFPGLAEDPAGTLEDNRFRHVEPEELVRLGLAARPAAPRGTYAYANTNYVIAGLLLEKATGQDAEDYITRNVIRKAGLRHTYFPQSARIRGPHAKMYESMYGTIAPARDFSVYDMSWAGTAGALVSTTDDLADFYRRLLGGTLLGPAALAAMKTTVPAYEPEPGDTVRMRYGLGIYTLQLPGGGWYWGHDGGVFGAGTWALSSEDGKRQVAIGYNLMKYERFDDQGRPLPDPIGAALVGYVYGALGEAPAPAGPAAARGQAPAPGPLPTRQHLVGPGQLLR
ncbi:serine hydrolase domain-containing protein [Streptomyces subrutilus]|uniref:serine hydrolase domain-containing protein n=1 Tax=Streptomyces subrutilus TaxID=36818 RepID=UPI002E0E534E|nr:beta-lactamase family protein [Streptomyces subrutilus]